MNVVAVVARLLVAHRCLERNLFSCSQKSSLVKQNTLEAYCQYALYTLDALEEQLASVDMIWYPAFTSYEPHFYHQIRVHDRLRALAEEARKLLSDDPRKTNIDDVKLDEVASIMLNLYDDVTAQYDIEEAMLDKMGHQVPLKALEHLVAEQKQRKVNFVAKHGQFWCATYLARTLHPDELQVVPPDLPRVLASVMMSAASLQYSK